uniref:EB domain-containing protein n=1 Tax=Elaeophora elaphi TaxID=1147741 RepID=A0A0R3RK73_9BILA
MRKSPGIACNIAWDTGMIESPDGNPHSYMRCVSIGFGTLGMWKLESCLPGYTFQINEKRCTPAQDASHVNNKFFVIEAVIALITAQSIIAFVTVAHTYLSLDKRQIIADKECRIPVCCANGEECIGGTVCNMRTMRCSCPIGTKANLNTLSCVPSSSPFKSLQQNGYNAYSSSAGEVMATTGNNVLPNAFNVRIPPGSSCSNNEICGGGSFCSLPMKLCLCPDDMEDFEGQCQKPQRSISIPAAGKMKVIARTGLGASCSDAVRRLNGTICLDGQCRYPIPLVQEGNRCVEKLSEVGPGEMCNASKVCSRGSICHPVTPVCVCPENTVLRENSCFPFASGIRNPITNIWATAEAASTTTKVMQKFPVGIGGTGQIGVGFPCYANTDCIRDAFCKITNNSATCQCLSTHINFNGFCEKALYPGQSGCHHDVQCTVTYAASRCYAGQCICPDGFSAIEQTCKLDEQRAQVPPGGICMIDRDCKGDSKCQDGWCICPEVSMKVINGICKKVYGDSLLNNSSAVNTLTSDIAITLPPISSFSSGVASTISKISPEGTDKAGMLATFVLPITSSTVSDQQHIGDVLPINNTSQWQVIASTATVSTSLPSSVSARLPGQPRITGPPLRKPRPQTSTTPTYKTRPGNGICPTPNSVLRDESTNYLIVCNGQKPLCPPNSYCYITGYANEEYNCCNS